MEVDLTAEEPAQPEQTIARTPKKILADMFKASVSGKSLQEADKQRSESKEKDAKQQHTLQRPCNLVARDEGLKAQKQLTIETTESCRRRRTSATLP
jgi:hypothetical protein